jgi:hypothetical protein
MNTLSFVLLASVISATPQPKDLLRYGDNTFAISQVPMLGLWHYEETDPGDGRTRAPEFDFVGTGNWVGYDATWLIRDSKLFLFKMKAKRNGKVIRNEAIFPGKKFPLQATWFTGRIHLAVGDYDSATKQYESVIIFHITKGQVTKTTFEPSMDSLGDWDGVPDSTNNAP